MNNLVALADTFVGGLVKLCFLASATLMLVLVFVGAGDAFGSTFLGRGIPSATEFSAAVLAATVATALPYAQSRNDHIVVDILTTHFKGFVARFFSIIALMITLAVFVLLSYVLVESAQFSIRTKEFASASIAFPVYPFKVVYAFGVIVMTLELARQGLHALCARPTPEA